MLKVHFKNPANISTQKFVSSDVQIDECLFVNLSHKKYLHIVLKIGAHIVENPE